MSSSTCALIKDVTVARIVGALAIAKSVGAVNHNGFKGSL